MRKFFLLLLLAASLGIAAQQSGAMYVAAKTGLSMRDKPDAAAKVLEKIPYGTKVAIIPADDDLKVIITEGMQGYWQKVKYNNKTGYIIDSYLLPMPPPKLVTVKEMKNYLAQTTVPFGAKLVTKSGSMASLEGGGWELDKQLYKNGAEWHQFFGFEYASDTYFLPNFTIQQGFLLLRLIPEFKDAFGEKDELPIESKTFQKGEVEYIIKVDKVTYENNYPWIEKIHVEFTPDANYILEMYMLDNQLVIFFGSGV